MADGTQISWAGTTLNISSGCEKCSEGCLHCYIERTPPFRIAHRAFVGDGIGAKTDIQLHLERLALPLRWRKPRTIFVNSLSDLFHKEIPDEVIARLWVVMAMTPRHTFQILTKRPARMRALLNSGQRWQKLLKDAFDWAVDNVDARMPVADVERVRAWINLRSVADDGLRPLKNVWLGTSTENQQWANVRIPQLLMAPAAVRFISAEPLLGPIDLTQIEWNRGGGTHLDVINGLHGVPGLWQAKAKRLDWVIVGGESGPGARPMHPDWARDLRDQCTDVGIAFHFKQHGEWSPIGLLYCDDDGPGSIADQARMDAVHAQVVERREVIQLERDGYIVEDHQPGDPRTWLMAKVGKRAAGRELDGRTWDQFPERVA